MRPLHPPVTADLALTAALLFWERGERGRAEIVLRNICEDAMPANGPWRRVPGQIALGAAAWRERGRMAMELGQGAVALHAFGVATDVDPSDQRAAELYVMAAARHGDQTDQAKAQAALDRVLALWARLRRDPVGERRRLAMAIAERGASGRPVMLHFGCGPNLLDGFLNIDHQPHPDFIADGMAFVERPDYFIFPLAEIPAPSNSVDLVFHEDFLEHLPQRLQYQFMAEARRLLKPGAYHRVSTPDLRESMRVGSRFEDGWCGVDNFEWDSWCPGGHVNVLTETTLREMAEIVGYSQVRFGHKNVTLSPLKPIETRPSGDRDARFGNIFADLMK